MLADLRAPSQVGLWAHLLLPLRQGRFPRKYEVPDVQARH